jgi:hypothetical protein
MHTCHVEHTHGRPSTQFNAIIGSIAGMRESGIRKREPFDLGQGPDTPGLPGVTSPGMSSSMSLAACYASDTDEQLTVPSRNDKIGILNHPSKTIDVINRTPFAKSGAQQDISKTILRWL